MCPPPILVGLRIYFKLETRGTHLVEDKRVADSHHQKRHSWYSDNQTMRSSTPMNLLIIVTLNENI